MQHLLTLTLLVSCRMHLTDERNNEVIMVVYMLQDQTNFKKSYRLDARIACSTFEVNYYYSLKCRTPSPLMANVVYKFQCLSDVVDCVSNGKTMRHLATRVREHGISICNS